MVEQVEHSNDDQLWDFAKKVTSFLTGLTLMGRIGLMFGLVVIPGFVLAILYAVFTLPSDDPQSWTDTERAEECLMIGREWNDKTLSCDMTPIAAIFTSHVSKYGRSSMSEHLAYNKFRDTYEERGGSVKLRGCLYLLQTELQKQGLVFQSIYDEDVVDACTEVLYPKNS